MEGNTEDTAASEEATASESTAFEATAFDAFSPTNAPGVNLIVNMRIYDVLMAIYTHLDKEGATDLLKLHQSGVVLSSAPMFTGDFLVDILNSQSDVVNSHSDADNTVKED